MANPVNLPFRILTLWTVFTLAFSPAALAAGGMPTLGLPQDLPAAGAGSEFVSGNYPGAVLMPVNLWGAVGKPGIHHVPTHTDLITLLSLAGGTVGEAELKHITIKRRSGDRDEVIEVDGRALLTRTDVRNPVLEPNDIVLVPLQQPIVSNNAVTVLSIVTSVVGLVLAGFAISYQARNR